MQRLTAQFLLAFFVCSLSLLAHAQSYIYDGTKTKLLIDVRTAQEFDAGHVAGAKNIPYDQISAGIGQIKGIQKDAPILLYCRSGHRAGIAKQTLEGLGFQKIQNGGGMDTLMAKLKVCNEPNC